MKKTRTKCNEQEWIRRVEPHPDAPTLRVKKREEQSRDRSRRCNCPLGTSGQVWDRNKEYLEFAYAGNNLRNWQRTNRKKRRRKEERRNVKGIIIRNRFQLAFIFRGWTGLFHLRDDYRSKLQEGRPERIRNSMHDPSLFSALWNRVLSLRVLIVSTGTRVG